MRRVIVLPLLRELCGQFWIAPFRSDFRQRPNYKAKERKRLVALQISNINLVLGQSCSALPQVSTYKEKLEGELRRRLGDLLV